MVLDSDDEPPHEVAHEALGDPRCRLCKLRTLAKETQARLKPAWRDSPLQLAFGLAVPCIEAWLLHGKDPKVHERAWTSGLSTGRRPFTRNDLKTRVYGTPTPDQPLATDRGVDEATRTAADLDGFQKAHPGFGALAADLRRWTR